MIRIKWHACSWFVCCLIDRREMGVDFEMLTWLQTVDVAAAGSSFVCSHRCVAAAQHHQFFRPTGCFKEANQLI